MLAFTAGPSRRLRALRLFLPAIAVLPSALALLLWHDPLFLLPVWGGLLLERQLLRLDPAGQRFVLSSEARNPWGEGVVPAMPPALETRDGFQDGLWLQHSAGGTYLLMNDSVTRRQWRQLRCGLRCGAVLRRDDAFRG